MKGTNRGTAGEKERTGAAARRPRVFVALSVFALAAGIPLYAFAGEGGGAGSIGQADARNVAAGCEPTETNAGGANNYIPDAPMDDDLGDGLVVSGTVREAGTCEPVEGARVQIWLSTADGDETAPGNRGSVLTDGRGRYRIETDPVVSQFGQPNVHVAYDDGEYGPVFQRLVSAEDDANLAANLVLQPGG